MDSFINITSLDWILMDVFDFLPHHHFVLYLLRMNPLLPELICSIVFMRFLIKGQLFQNRSDIMFIKIADQLFRHKGFKTSDISIQLIALYNHVQMIFEDDKGVYFQPIRYQEAQGIKQNIDCRGTCKNRYPM